MYLFLFADGIQMQTEIIHYFSTEFSWSEVNGDVNFRANHIEWIYTLVI
jgi:hypothetical protein